MKSVRFVFVLWLLCLLLSPLAAFADPGLGLPAYPLVGNPINHANGNKYQTEDDYLGAGQRPLNFSRYYNSADKRNGVLGKGWRHTFERWAERIDARTIRIHREDGGFVEFAQAFIGTEHWATTTRSTTEFKQLYDAQGQIAGWQYTDMQDHVETYNAAGRLTSIANRAGQMHNLTYDTTGRLTTVSNGYARQLSFAYDAQGRLLSFTDPAGNITQYGYDSGGRLVSVTRPDLKVRTYLYENAQFPNALTGIIDENNQRYVTWTYDTQGRATSSENAGIGKVTLAFGTNGTTTVTNALGGAKTYTFQYIRRTWTIQSIVDNSCATCQPEQYAYDTARGGLLTARTDRKGNITQYGINLKGLPDLIIYPNQETAATVYHDVWRLPVYTDQGGANRTEYEYDSKGNLTKRTVTDGTSLRVWQYTYNSAGLLISEKGPRTDVNQTTSYTYDAQGNIATITNPLGRITRFTQYDAHGRPLQIIDENNATIQLTYDSRGQLLSASRAGLTTQFSYDGVGQLLSVQKADGTILNYSYHPGHYLTGISDALGNRIEYQLDAMGNVKKAAVYDSSNVLARSRSWTFDAAGRVSQAINGLGVATSYQYDENGRAIQINAPLNRQTRFSYDLRGRMSTSTDAMNGVSSFGYDIDNVLIQFNDPIGLATVYSRDALGNISQQDSMDSGTTLYSYNIAGLLKTRTDARGNVATYTYDALDRLTKIAYTGETVNLQYDTGSNAIGRLNKITDGSGNTAWQYNTLGLVTSKTQTIGTLARTVGYSYNAAGQRIGVTYPSGLAVTYGYGNGRTTSVTANGQTLLNNILYEPFGDVRGWTWGNSKSHVRLYDQDGQLTWLDSSGVKTYTYDAAGRITQMVEGSKTQTAAYDLLDRLTQYSGNNKTQSYQYDANGNRLKQVWNGVVTDYTMNTNQLFDASTATTYINYSYDPAGNLLSDGTYTYTYNGAGRLASAKKGSATSNYKVNALGQRVSKTGSGGNIRFVYDEQGHLIGEYDANGVLIQETIWLDDTPVAVVTPKTGGGININYVHVDNLGSPRVISDATGKALWRWDSDAFGVGAPNEDPDGDTIKFTYNLRFPGQYYDKETGLHYNYFRDYDPKLGRYTQSDPIGLSGGFNPYGYVGNQPFSMSDEFGLKPDISGEKLQQCDMWVDVGLPFRVPHATLCKNGECRGYNGAKGKNGKSGSWQNDNDALNTIKWCRPVIPKNGGCQSGAVDMGKFLQCIDKKTAPGGNGDGKFSQLGHNCQHGLQDVVKECEKEACTN